MLERVRPPVQVAGEQREAEGGEGIELQTTIHSSVPTLLPAIVHLASTSYDTDPFFLSSFVSLLFCDKHALGILLLAFI